MLPVSKSFEEMLDIWEESTKQSSGNLVSNAPLPDSIRKKILQTDNFDYQKMKRNIKFNPTNFLELQGKINRIPGFEILSGLQNLFIPNYLTLFRAVRFPTPKRICQLVNEGYSISNYEQERLQELYHNPQYIKKREEILKDPWFPLIPQERIVKGVPAFLFANDAIQIHNAYRSDIDKIALIALFIPSNLLENKQIELYSNTAIDVNIEGNYPDKIINHFEKQDEGRIIPNYKKLLLNPQNIYESYLQGLPFKLKKCEEKEIQQRFFILDLYKFRKFNDNFDFLSQYKNILKYESFLHGFNGENSFIGRKKSEYLPFKCAEILKK